MIMHLNKIFLMTLAATTLLFSQNTLGLNINTEDFEVEGAMDINAFTEYSNGTTYIIDANFINTEDDSLFGMGFSAHNSFQGLEGLSLGLGARVLFLEDYMALPLMAEASYALPLIDAIPTMSLSAKLLYAPSVLSFSDAENYFEFRAEAAMEVINAVSIYAGYRDIEIQYIDSPELTFNDSFYAGLKMSF
jgi:hypothetical protein